MTTIESKHVTVARPVQEVIDYTKDLRHFERLLPRDRISDFQSDGDTCSFKIQGMATIGLRVKEVLEHSLIIESTDSPFSFTLDIRMAEKEGGTEAYQIVNLDLNPMMKMMVEKPMRNLFDHIADRL